MFLIKICIRTVALVFKMVPYPRPSVITGPNASTQLAVSVSHFQVKRILIVTDEILVNLGIIEPIAKALNDNGVETVIFDAVEPNPTFQVVEGGLDMLVKEGCDSVLAVGGGSPIDSAKVIALAAANPHMAPKKFDGYFKGKHQALPFFAIPTTAGTGSEVSIGAVISDAETHQKSIIVSNKIVPRIVAIDPNLMTGMPRGVTAATGMDALTHSIEAYISGVTTTESNVYALSSIKMIFSNLRECYDNGSNVVAREAMATAAYYGGLAMNQAYLGYVHGIAHQFSAHYNTPHGLANALVLPRVLEFNKDVSASRFAELAIAVGLGTSAEPEVVLAQKFIDGVIELSAAVGIPTSLELLKESDFPAITKAALKEAHMTYPVSKYMTPQECTAILHKLLYVAIPESEKDS